jgi:hypothetical protein
MLEHAGLHGLHARAASPASPHPQVLLRVLHEPADASRISTEEQPLDISSSHRGVTYYSSVTRPAGGVPNGRPKGPKDDIRKEGNGWEDRCGVDESPLWRSKLKKGYRGSKKKVTVTFLLTRVHNHFAVLSVCVCPEPAAQAAQPQVDGGTS